MYSFYILNPAEKYYVAYVINFGAGIKLQIGRVTLIYHPAVHTMFPWTKITPHTS